jgi:hypothetical protein
VAYACSNTPRGVLKFYDVSASFLLLFNPDHCMRCNAESRSLTLSNGSLNCNSFMVYLTTLTVAYITGLS